jgi:hypothetical protein
MCQWLPSRTGLAPAASLLIAERAGAGIGLRGGGEFVAGAGASKSRAPRGPALVEGLRFRPTSRFGLGRHFGPADADVNSLMGIL